MILNVTLVVVFGVATAAWMFYFYGKAKTSNPAAMIMAVFCIVLLYVVSHAFGKRMVYEGLAERVLQEPISEKGKRHYVAKIEVILRDGVLQNIVPVEKSATPK